MDLNLQSRADYETWDVSKNAVTGKNGIVVAQEIEAANIGKQVLLEEVMQLMPRLRQL